MGGWGEDGGRGGDQKCDECDEGKMKDECGYLCALQWLCGCLYCVVFVMKLSRIQGKKRR